MGVSRRDFLKIGGGAALVSTVVGLAPDEAKANTRANRLKGATVTTSICPYCAVGCGLLVATKNGKVISIEGDPEHPVSRGSLCPKGALVLELAYNPLRVTKPRYRAPGATDWKEVEWDWALGEIASYRSGVFGRAENSR